MASVVAVVVMMTALAPSYTTAQARGDDGQGMPASAGEGCLDPLPPLPPLSHVPVSPELGESLDRQVLMQEIGSLPRPVPKGSSGESATGEDDEDSSRKDGTGDAERGMTPPGDEDGGVAEEGVAEGTDADGNSGGDVEPGPSWPSFVAKHETLNYSAHDDGSINEWAPGYYDAHDWSEAGQAIHASDVGDVIIIDDTPVTITGRCYLSEYETYEDIRARLGNDCVIFQTCAGAGTILVLTGHADGWGPFGTLGAEQPSVSEDRVVYSNIYGTFDTPEEAEAAIEAAEGHGDGYDGDSSVEGAIIAGGSGLAMGRIG